LAGCDGPDPSGSTGIPKDLFFRRLAGDGRVVAYGIQGYPTADGAFIRFTRRSAASGPRRSPERETDRPGATTPVRSGRSPAALCCRHATGEGHVDGRRRARAAAGFTLLAGLAACAPAPATTAKPTPAVVKASPSASPLPSAPAGSAYPPNAVLAAVDAALRRLGEPAPVTWDTAAVGTAAPLSVCGLRMDGRGADRTDLRVAADYAGHVRLNPIPDLSSYAGRPTVVAQIDVAHLRDATAAGEAVRTAVGTECDDTFSLFGGPDEARRAGETMRIGTGDARLTTGTLGAGTRATSLGFTPGAARLVFAYGPLILDVLVLEVRPADERPDKATSAARDEALAVASDVIWGLPK
jgi:hypothetical protein